MALQQMHIFHATEVPVQRRRKNNDRNMRASATKKSGDLSAKLASSEVVVEHGDVDFIEELRGLLDRGGRDTLIAVLAQNGRAKMQISRLVVE